MLFLSVVEESACRLIFEEDYMWDKTVGRDDNFSLRMENNAKALVYIGYNGSSAKAKKAELSMWVKVSPDWRGTGIRFGVEGRGRFGGVDIQWDKYAKPKPGKWTQIKFAIPFPTAGLICTRI